jgi:hypothetical protein
LGDEAAGPAGQDHAGQDDDQQLAAIGGQQLVVMLQIEGDLELLSALRAAGREQIMVTGSELPGLRGAAQGGERGGGDRHLHAGRLDERAAVRSDHAEKIAQTALLAGFVLHFAAQRRQVARVPRQQHAEDAELAGDQRPILHQEAVLQPEVERHRDEEEERGARDEIMPRETAGERPAGRDDGAQGREHGGQFSSST